MREGRRKKKPNCLMNTPRLICLSLMPSCAYVRTIKMNGYINLKGTNLISPLHILLYTLGLYKASLKLS